MDTSPARPHSGTLAPRWVPPSPGFAIAGGILLAFLGGWTLSDGEPPAALGWAFTVVGAALLLTGGVAKGVAWGLALHEPGGR